MSTIINFNDYIKNNEGCLEVAAAVAETKTQMTYGDWVEHNIIQSLKDYYYTTYCSIAKTPQYIDYLFGADFLMEFSNPDNHYVNGMMNHIDITCNMNKRVDLYFNGANGISKDRIELLHLENGFTVSVGVKTRHSSRFRYKKPVLVLFLDAKDKMLTPIFSENDAFNISIQLRRASYFLSYLFKHLFGNELQEGCGKRTSMLVELNDKKEEV